MLSPIEGTDTSVLRIFTPEATFTSYTESNLAIDYISRPLAVYKDMYVFQQNSVSKEI